MTPPYAEYEPLPMEKLRTPHREILTRAIANVVASQIAKETFAQIVDGLPLSNVAWDSYSGCLCSLHPLLDEHKELCPGVAEEAQKLCFSFDTSTLLMSSKVKKTPKQRPADVLLIAWLSAPSRLRVCAPRISRPLYQAYRACCQGRSPDRFLALHTRYKPA